MGEMENQAEFYYEKLKSQTNPGLVLLEFFRDITGRDAGRSEIIMINRLIKLFGRFIVYFSIMDLSKSAKLEGGDLYPLLYTICRSRFEKSHEVVVAGNAYEPLNKKLELLDKQMEKIKKAKPTKLPSSEGLA